jgi:hypothetical protein
MYFLVAATAAVFLVVPGFLSVPDAVLGSMHTIKSLCRRRGIEIIKPFLQRGEGPLVVVIL